MRFIRFLQLLPHAVAHMWYASKFEHTTYVIHRTNSLRDHKLATRKIKTLKKIT